MLSPVCTPMGSRFSMLQTVIQLSAPSRITSYSISFQPTRERSSRTWDMGLLANPLPTMASNSSQVLAMPPPLPPRVYAGRTTKGRPSSFPRSLASSLEEAMAFWGSGSPISPRNLRNRSRSSHLRMVSKDVPSRRMSYLSRTPASARATARFRPVWPPSVARIPSGCSRLMIR